jgi:hypothetical protein
MNPLTRKAFINETADLYKEMCAYRARLSSLAAATPDVQTLGELALMEESVRRAQRCLTKCLTVVYRETEGRP